MAATIVAGSKFFVGPQKAAVTLADYEANDITWTEVTGVQDMGEIGDEAEAVKVLTIGDARQRTYRGARSGGEITLTCVRDAADAGQTAMTAAFTSVAQTNFMFKVTLPDTPVGGVSGSLLFFSGAVLSAARKIAGANDVIQTMFKVSINSDVLEVAAA